jgi:hypothetical protein
MTKRLSGPGESARSADVVKNIRRVPESNMIDDLLFVKVFLRVMVYKVLHLAVKYDG